MCAIFLGDKKSLAQKSPDKNALCNVPRGQKGVCKNKSPDQITLYNNFVQLSERSNCASDHFERNLIFLAKFSNKISKIKQKQKPLAICLDRYYNFLQQFQETKLFIVVIFLNSKDIAHLFWWGSPSCGLLSQIRSQIRSEIASSQFPSEIARWVFDFGTNCTYSAPRGATKGKTWSIFLLISTENLIQRRNLDPYFYWYELMHCSGSLDCVRHHFWFRFLESLQWDK